MTFDELYETLPGTGWLTKNEAQLLWTCAGETAGAIVEIGCYYGRATTLLASFGRPVVCVDPFAGFDSNDPTGEKAYRAFMTNTASFPCVILHRMRIEDWQPEPAGLVYCDGDHTYEGTLAQVKKALECDPKIIAVHDVNDRGGGADVKKACLELLGPWMLRVERLAVWQL